jgi:hypothetical protein
MIPIFFSSNHLYPNFYPYYYMAFLSSAIVLKGFLKTTANVPVFL